MASFTQSVRTGNTIALQAADSLFVTQLGSVIVSNNNQVGVTGQGSNSVVVDGVISSQNGAGLEFNGGNNAVLVDPTGFVFGAANGITIFNVAGKTGTVYNYGEIQSYNAHAISTTAAGSTVKLFSGSTTIGFDIGVEVNAGANVNNAGLLVATSGSAVQSGSMMTLINSGTMLGRNNAAFLGGAAANDLNYIVNSGTMRAVSGPTVNSSGSSLNMVNSGTIDSGLNTAITENTGTLNLLNSGYVFGRSYIAIQTDVGAVRNDTIINNGFIQGDLIAAQLGGGNDFFDGRNGLQFGQVWGDDGNDVLFGGTGNDMLFGGNGDDALMGNGAGDLLDGGAGFDYARYDLGGAVTASLATPAANSGDAAGDTYSSIEGLVGSQVGDVLVGDGSANTILGLGGQDGIAGGGGNDTIYGGAGGDVISGGAGADTFVYTSLGDAGDLITDWNVGGTQDKIDLRPLFDLTLYAGMTPRQDNILQVNQNGADTDIYTYGTFMLRLANTNAATVTDATSFIFQ